MTAASATVVLPTFNERETVVPIVSQLLDSEWVAEIVVVDDDSPDETWRVVREQFGDDPAVRAIRRTEESGLSSAVLRGFDAAETEIVACMDADGQHPIGATLALIRRVQGGADLAVGSRHAETGSIDDDWPLWRQVVSYGAAGLAWTAVPQARGLTDPMSGLFAIRRDVVEAVRTHLRPRGYKILLELLARCPIDSIAEHGYTFSKREAGGSNLGPAEYVDYVRHLGRLTVPSRRDHAQQEVQPHVADRD